MATFRAFDPSMKGRIESAQLCTVALVNEEDLKRLDIVLCRIRKKKYFYSITVSKEVEYQIGNNLGHINGWTTFKSIFGELAKVEP